LAKFLSGGSELRSRNILGPGSAPHANENAPGGIPRPAFDAAVKDVNQFVEVNRRVPSEVFIGSKSVSPAAFLVAMADVVRRGTDAVEAVSLPSQVSVRTERHVASDDGRLFSGWVIHPPGFRAPHIMEIAKLQAWTLKPALRTVRSDKDRAAQ